MDFAQMEPYCTANDQVNHSCGILIDEGTSGAPSSRIREPRQSLLRVRSFGVDTASRPVEIGALLTLSRGQTTSQSSWRPSNVVFFSRLVRGTQLRPAPSDRGSRGAPGAPPPWAWGVKTPRGTEAKTARSHGAKGQVRNTGARFTAYGPRHNLHRTHTSQTQKTASAYLERV